MNAKEEIIRELKARKYELNKEVEPMIKAGFSEESMEYKIVYSFLDRINHLITSVENAIFDVPSEEELIKESPTIDTYDEFIQYLRNYNKPETDGK